MFGREKKSKDVLVECPYAKEGSKDFCDPKKPFRLNLSHPDFQKEMEEHTQRHVERDSAMLGLTIKRLGCPICDWQSKPYPSNNAFKLGVQGREEMQAQIDLDDHINGNSERYDRMVKLAEDVFAHQKDKAVEAGKDLNEEALRNYLDEVLRPDFENMQASKEEAEVYSGHLSCKRHETPGHEILVYYFRDKEEKDLHEKLLHAPKVKPQNPKLKNVR